MVFEQNGVAHVYEANGSKLEMLYDLKDSRTAILHLPEGGYDVLSIDQDDKFTITHSSMGRTVVWYHFSGPVMTPRMLAFQASGLTLKGDFDGALALWSRIPSSFNPVFSCDNVRFHAGQPVRIIPRSGDIQAAKEAKAKIDSSHFTREAAIAFYQKRRNDFAVTKTCTP